MAVPLHIQRLRRALDLSAFISQVHASSLQLDRLLDPLGDVLLTGSTDNDLQSGSYVSVFDEPVMGCSDWPHLSASRRQLATDLLMTSSDESADESLPNDERLSIMLRQHRAMKKRRSKRVRRSSSSGNRSVYYSAGLVSTNDRYIPTVEELKADRELAIRQEQSVDAASIAVTAAAAEDPSSGNTALAQNSAKKAKPSTKKTKKSKEQVKDALKTQRHKLWMYIAKKEIAKSQRSMCNGRKDKCVILKRMAAACTRAARQRALQSQRVEKELTSRMKRLSREMQSYWRRCGPVEKETRKQFEQDGLEQRKLTSELLENKNTPLGSRRLQQLKKKKKKNPSLVAD